MKLAPRKREEISSATIAQTLGLILACSVLFAMTAFAADPSWWSSSGTGSQGAVLAPQITTNSTTGLVTTNYVRNDQAVVTQGQLKQFTARAVDELNANLSSGAGTNLNTMVNNWAQDYATNGYNATNIKPSDYTAMNVGQLKYIGNQVWARLVAGHQTNALPSWLVQNTNSDNALANLGQLKEVFNFDLSTAISEGAPKITGFATVTAGVGVPFSYAITASNSPTSYSASGLPPGLSLNASSGVITGTPTAVGVSIVYLTATNSAGTGTGFVVLNIVFSSAAPVINSSAAVGALADTPIAYQITASNNPTLFGATNLPSGLTINTSTGVISGTISASGTYTINLSASNGNGTGTEVLSLAINSGASSGGQQTIPVITSSSTALGASGQSFSYSIVASNTPTSFGAANLPDGLSLNVSTGVISGAPTSGGLFFVAISATNTNGTTYGLLIVTIGYAVPSISSSITDNATTGTEYIYSIQANNNPASYSASGLPSGLTLNSNTGIISGTPTTTGTFSITLGATNAAGTGSATLVLTVGAPAPPIITSPSGASVSVDQIFSYQITASNGPSSFGASGLPVGLSVDAATGVISGTPIAASTTQVVISAINANGTGSATLTLTVVPQSAPVISSPATTYATIGQAFAYNITATNNPTSFYASNLPGGLSCDPITGIISGTPLSVGSANAVITATNALGQVSSLLMIVVQASTPNVPVIVSFTDGSPVNYQVSSTTIVQDSSDPDVANEPDPGEPYMVGQEGTQSYRTLINFDLSSLPANSTITGVSISYAGNYAIAADSAFNIELHQIVEPFDPNTADWTTNSSYEDSLLSTESADPNGTDLTWSSSSSFVSAVQGAIASGGALDLMLVSPDAERSETGEAVYLFSPVLTVTYLSSAPPVITDNAPVSVNSGQAFSYQVTALNEATSYSATGLPSGLTIDTSSGVISGTTTASGIYPVTIYATNANGTGAQAFTLQVGNLTANATVGSSFTYSIPSTGLLTTYNSSYLPGLTIDSLSGTLSGTLPPDSAGTYNITISATNAFGTSPYNLVLTVAPIAPVITGQLTPLIANQNIPLSAYYVPSDGQPNSFALSPNLINLGLSIDSYGNVTGTPTTVGTFQGSVTDSNSAGTSSAAPLTVSVSPVPVPTVAAQSAIGVIGVDFGYSASASIATAPNSSNVSPTYSAEGLPAGLSMASNGYISGTPSGSLTSATNYTVTITASDATGYASGILTLTLYPPGPGIGSLLTSNARVGQYYYYGLIPLGNLRATGTSATGLPPGLVFSNYGSTGMISGMPTTPGVYQVSLATSNSTGVSTATLVLTVAAISSASNASAQVGVPFSFTVTDPESTVNFQASNLPPGFSINSSTGVITGTPVAADTVPVTVTATDSSGTSTQLLTITISPASTDSSTSFQQGVSPTSQYAVPSATISMDSGNASTADQTFESSSVLTVGETTATASSRALLGFDLSSLPVNATITSATLVLNTSAGSSIGDTMIVEVHQADAAFASATATWNNNAGYDGTILSSLTLDPSSSAGINSFPLSKAFAQAAQQAFNKGAPLYLTLAAPGIESVGVPDYLEFLTNDTSPAQNPELIVTYTVGTPRVPVITSASSVAGTVNVPVNYAITATNNPQKYSATGLPSGLALNTTTGIISGTVTTIGSTVATIKATNSAGTGTQEVTFNTDSTTPATSLQVISGTNQVGAPSTFLGQPLVAQANYNGAVLANALVTFTVPKGQGAFALTNTGNPITANTITVKTNSAGKTLDVNGNPEFYFLLPQTLGTTTLIASAGTAQPVSFVETSALNVSGSNDSLVLLSIMSGEGQSGPAGQSLPQPFVVEATNASGQPIPNLPLSLSILSGGGSIVDSSGGGLGTTPTVSTDSYGNVSIYLQPGGSNKTINKVACTPSANGSGATVYLTALTSSNAGSSPTPGGGTAPSLDTDPQPWNGRIWITETDEDNGNTYNPDPTKITLHWTAATAGIAGFYVEKKVSTQDWGEFNTYNSGQTSDFDTGLQANEEVQYRVTPYINGNLGSPSAPVNYIVPLLRSLDVRTRSASGNMFNNGVSGPFDFQGSPSTTETAYLVATGICTNGSLVSTAIPELSPGLPGVGVGALNWGLDSEPPIPNFDYGSLIETLYTNPYTRSMLIGDVNTCFAGYSSWITNYFGWGNYAFGYWGWNWGSEQSNFEEVNYYQWNLAGRHDDFSSIYSRVGSYEVYGAQYQFEAYPAKNTSMQWAEIFVVDDPTGKLTLAQRTKIINVQNWTVNSSSLSQSSVYEINPIQYNQFGDYYIAPVPQLTVTDGEFSLDSEQKATTGEPVPLVVVTAANPLTYGEGAAFSISNGELSDQMAGATYTLSWSGSGASSMQVWGYDTITNTWNQVTSGQSITLNDGTSGWNGQFEVIATNQAQNSDSINLTLVSTAPDGTVLGTDSSKFNYTKPPPDLSMPIDEASGSRYRKIALNGLPMGDEKPQQSAESDQEKEETYVDALTLGLRHSTTDVYMPVSGSDFSVSARRDFRSQVWEDRNGLRPHEEPDEPFGMCWSSNLAPNIKLTHNNDPTSTTPDEAIVTDETGAVHTFYRWYDTNGNAQFFPMPTAKNEAQVPNLETLTVNSSANPVTYTFTRKYGANLTYQTTTLTQTISNDRLLGNQYSTIYQYARLIQAVDRVGNTVNYQFQGTTNLIPATITVANQPGIKLSIEQQPISALIAGCSNSQSVITAIWDANGNKTSYTYTISPIISGGSTPIDPEAVVLTSVTTPDGATTQYSYNPTTEPDLTPHMANAVVGMYSYVDLASITDPLGNTYSFTYNLDHSKLNFMNNPQIPFDNYYAQSGCPRNINTVTMPDSTTAHPDIATFSNNNNPVLSSNNHAIFLQQNPNGDGLVVSGPRINQVTDATGFTRTYTFGSGGNSTVIALPSFPQPSNSVTESKIVAYQNLAINYPGLGSETFQFDITAAMALKQITDLSGNVTTFAHTDAWSAPSTYTQIISNATLNGFYDDPTSQTDALGHSKSFTYFGGNRIMQSSTDENGNETYYDIDPLGRRTTEKLYDPSSHLIQETDFTYGNSIYPGFMTKKCVKAISGGNDPSWVHALVTEYTPDSNGRVAQETVDPGGLNLTTTYTYDANGNKLTAIDPKGQTTWFSYDTRNRLVTVTNADGSQKQMVYDARGNKTKEYDENGIATLYQYDSLNRLVAQARDMNGNGVIDSGTDLVTSFTYDKVNDKLTTTAPGGGITQMAYDALQRVTDIYSSPDNSTQYHTQFAYGSNSGGNAFDSSSFKPTHSVDPRGFTTDVTYDKLYRPVTKAVQYNTSQAPSSTSTKYDNVGNALLVTDPLGHQTTVQYDALNRPVLTTGPDNTTTQASYTSTGFKWKTIDQNGNTTETQYDNAGRLTIVTGAQVDNGSGTLASPITTTAYDAAGNVAETVNPLGNKWDYVYDARNRKIQELEPAVLDKDPASATYNSSGRPTMTWLYDAAGRITATIDARGNETDTVYDAANRVTDVNSPSVPFSGGSARPHTHSTYDLDSNVLTLRDADGHTTTNTYDLLNRLLTSTDALSITVTNTYDQVGNKLTVTDGNSHTTYFAYDGLNRNTAVTDAAGKSTTLSYDALNKTARIDALGQATTYLYDVRNRLQYVVYASNAAANSQRQYSYDYVGNLLAVTEQNKTSANVAYSYDALNRTITEISGGLTHAYRYDLASNRLGTLYGAAGVSVPTTFTATRILTSTYDTLNRLNTLQDQTPTEYAAGTTTGRTTSYGYDLNGNIVQKTLPNGDKETEAFDALNRSVTQDGTAGNSSSLYTYAYGYDLTGNVTSVGETYPSSGLAARTVTNTYDAINRLLVEAAASSTNITTTYGYDNANNRLTKAVLTGATTVTTSYSYNNLNQLTGYTDTGDTRVVTLDYDLDGNRSSRTVTGGSDNGTDTYSYDFENRLIGLVKGTAGGAGTYAYTYDYRTRRIIRDESGASGGVVTDLVFSGGTSVQEYTGSITSANLTVEYARGSDYGGGVGGILYTIRGGTPSYTHENHRGDVVAKTDASGNLTFQSQYEAFGKQVATSGSTLDRQKSNSKDTDPTGLVDEGFRYRDLETGMFINRDPAGFVDGPNLYTYVVQNPWTKFDPEGLTATDRVEGYAQGVTNGLIDLYNGAASLFNAIPRDEDAPGASVQAPTVAPVNNIGNATDKNDFISGQNGGSVFFAGGSAFVGGAEAKGTEAVVEGGEDALKAAGTRVAESPKPEPSPAPGAKPADETAPAAPSNAPPPGGCFIAGTPVSTPLGDVPIETIRAGDVVWSLDIKTGHVVEKKVESIFSHVTDDWVDVTAGGEKITATRGHRFWVESLKKWVPAMDLKPGMRLLASSGHIVPITQVHIRHLPADATTYNFFVADTHVYFVGQHRLLVHNGDDDQSQQTTKRVASKTLRNQWTKANQKPWPKDAKTGQNQDVSHKQALADKGTNDVKTNIEPLPHDDHVQLHKDNGDFKRWGARANKC